jgi:hypothetical protein
MQSEEGNEYSLMHQALKLLSTNDACRAGLGCDPSLLLLLALDLAVLDEQIPVGRCLLNALDSLNVRCVRWLLVSSVVCKSLCDCDRFLKHLPLVFDQKRQRNQGSLGLRGLELHARFRRSLGVRLRTPSSDCQHVQLCQKGQERRRAECVRADGQQHGKARILPDAAADCLPKRVQTARSDEQVKQCVFFNA